MKAKTIDRMRFYVTETIGEKRSETPEGFLICHDVPIARTGEQLYLSSEVPLEDAGNGEVRVARPAEEVFRTETIASFEGKAVTVEHPNEFVTPDNWQQLAIGTVQNVRKGEGLQDDLLIADLVITDKKAIEYVNKELPEVSAGYEATYEQEGPGRGVQRDIVGNHVALVERGRAGPRCSIQDRKPIQMKRNFWDRLMTAVKAKDEEAVKAELEAKKAEDEGEGGEGNGAKLDNQLDKEQLERLDRLEGKFDELLKVLGKTGDEGETEEEKAAREAEEAKNAKAAEDDGENLEEEEEVTDTILGAETAETNGEATGRVLSGDSIKKIVARAEILNPGSQFRTTDSNKAKKEAYSFIRSTLIKAYSTDSGKAAIDPLLAGRDLNALKAPALASIFMGAAEIMRVQNNARTGRSFAPTKDFGRVVTVADMNARNRDFWANRK